MKPVVCPQRGALHSQEIETRSFREDAVRYDRTGKPVVCRDENHMRHQSRGVINVDLVPSNVQSARQEALLYVFQDNEAVIKMIIKGRSSPTMRHVSRRTHRVALNWLFDRINLDPKIQIKYIDTKNQLAHMLTKGNFTRDEWNHLLCLFDMGENTSSLVVHEMQITFLFNCNHTPFERFITHAFSYQLAASVLVSARNTVHAPQSSGFSHS